MTDNLPSTRLFGDHNADDDFKDMREKDKVLPRLRLGQHTSQQVKDRLIEAGAWYNSATSDTVIPHDKLGIVVPVMFWLEWMEWNVDKGAPKGVGKGKAILARETDPNGPLAQSAGRFEKIQTIKGEKIRVTEYYSFLVLAPEYFGNYDDMMMLNFSKTSHKIGKSWLNRMRSFMVKDTDGSSVRAPLAAVGWELGRTVAENADKEKYFVAQVGKGTLLSADVIQHTLAVSNLCKQRREEVVKSNVADADDDSKDVKTAQVEPNSEL